MTNQTTTDPIEMIQSAVEKLRRNGAPLGEEKIIMGITTFGKLKSHSDVVSGQVTLQPLDDLNRWLVNIPKLGLSCNVFVSYDMSHWCNKEDNVNT